MQPQSLILHRPNPTHTDLRLVTTQTSTACCTAALSLVLHYLWLFSLGKKTNNNNKTTNSLRAFKAHKYNEPEAIWQTCLMAGGHLGPAAVVMLTRLPTSKEYVTCSQSITVTRRSEHFFLFVHPLLHFLPSISLEISFPYF